VRIEVAVRTDVGRVRDHNEDRPLVDEALGLYLVCDGMGGHAAGEVASELASRTVQETIRAAAGADSGEGLSPEAAARIEAVMRSALENANARVHELGQQDPAKVGAGTTCTALLVRDGRGYLGHVGDSRAYLKRQGSLHRLSADHCIIEEQVRGGVPREEAEKMFPVNALTRAIGPHASVLVDTLVFDVLPGDTFLLCSDGLYEYFPAESDELSPLLDEKVPQIAELLIALANERGGGDNITAVTLRIHADAAATATEAERTSRVQEDLAALVRMQLFNDMSYPELLEIADGLEIETVEEGTAIVTEGETSDNLYVISGGGVKVERADQIIAELGPGDHFGEMAVLTSRPRAATVRATEETRLLALPRQAIYSLFARRPAIGMKFLWTLAQVQSIRLDEALVWRALAEARKVDAPASGRLEDLERTVRMKPVTADDEGLKATLESDVSTKRLYPPPLSRRHDG
jgi:serine/threonine protein phosphatase PrpC/CRP-like cAMP-binding protein